MTEPQTPTEALAAMLRAEGSYFARYEAVAERLIDFMPDGWVLAIARDAAVGRAVRGAGYRIIREHWDGDVRVIDEVLLTSAAAIAALGEDDD